MIMANLRVDVEMMASKLRSQQQLVWHACAGCAVGTLCHTGQRKTELITPHRHVGLWAKSMLNCVIHGNGGQAVKCSWYMVC